MVVIAVNCKGKADSDTVNSDSDSMDMDSQEMELDAKAIAKSGMFSIIEDSTKVHFTAYKTTDKVPVGGNFLKADISYEVSESPKEIINGLEFSIPVSSLFTNDATGTRDPKILEFFFGVMAETELINGKFTVKDDQNCVASLTMNGVTADLPMVYSIDGQQVNFEGTIDLKNWNALEALASLNKACEILHTGPTDGISKTWEDVAVNASLLFEEK